MTEKPCEGFSRNKNTPSGLSQWCKPCANEASRAWVKGGGKARYTWRNMRSRCFNPRDISYPNYGGRGISVCEAWLDFEPFKQWFDATYVPGLVLDRVDNDKGYTPENCRWTTLSVQNKNKRVTQRQIDHMRRIQRLSPRNRKK
jgi:hypothetical protein